MANPVTRIIITATDQASSVFDGLRKHAGKIATAIAGYFGFDLFRSTVDSAREFEAAMSAVQAAAGASGEELAALRAAAEEVGATTKYTGTEAANALENLAKAGLSASDAVAALPAVLDLASAGGVDLATASEYITKAVAGMGMSFAEAGRVADVLAMGANASNSSVTGLSQALSYAAPLANSLGLSLEQTVAIIGKFADAGIDASRAGTALNSVMAQFADPASKFRRELADAGITTTDFDKALRQLAAAGPRGAKAINAVGMEAGPALRALLNQGIGSLDQLKAKLDASAGSAKTFAAVMDDNLNGATESLGSAWEALKIKLGTPVLETLKNQVNAVAERLRGFVDDGTADRFGEAIKSAFEAGGKWVADFFSKVDFKQVAADMQAFATRAGEVFDAVGAKASAAGNATKAVYGVMSAGVYAVITAWNSLIRILYNVQEAVFRVADGFNRALASITFGDASAAFDRLAKEAETWADRAAEAARRFAEKSGESLAGVVRGAELANAGFAGLSGAAEAASVGTTAALDAVEKKAQTTAERIAELRAEQQKLIAEGDIDGATKIWREIVKLSTEAANAAKASGAAQRGEVAATKASVAELRAEYDRLFEAGDIDAANAVWKQLQRSINETAGVASASAAKQRQEADATAAKLAELREAYRASIEAGDAQRAAQIQQQIRAELNKTKGAANDVGSAVDAAFQGLGINSKKEFERLAATAKRHFETIQSSGTATPREIQAAFSAYAEKAIAANDGVASSALKAEAVQRGVTLEVDNGNRALVSGMEGAAEASAQAGQAAEGGAQGMRNMAAAAAQGGTVGEAFKEIWDKAVESIRDVSPAAADAMQGLLESSAGFEEFAAKVRGLSQSATQLVAENPLGDLQGQLAEVEAAAAKASANLETMENINHRFNMGLSFAGWRDSIAAMEGLELSLLNAKKAQIEFSMEVERYNDSVDEGNLSLGTQEALLSGLVARAEELGAQDLSDLRSALDDVREQMASIKDDAESALASLTDELDEINGNYEAIERRRAASRRADIEAQIKEAKAAGNGEAVAALNEAIGKLAQVETARVAEARERSQKEERAGSSASEPAGVVSQRPAGRERDQSARAASAPSAPSAQVLGVYRVDVRTRTGTTPISVASTADADALFAVLEEAASRS